MVRSLRKRLGRFLGDNPIASVICTHFFAPAALVKLREKKGFDFKIFVAITDYDAHPFWSMPGVDGYFVANDTAKKRLMKVDVPRELVKVCGVPIEMKYMRWRPRDLARRKLGLSRRREGVLVVCGKNERLRRRLEDYTPVGDNEIKLYGFVDHMDMMYDACDLVVTKPGGVTSAELLAKGVPVVSMEIFGGQERRNLEYLHHSGGLFEVGDVEEGVERVAELLPRKKYLAKLKRRMRRFARPDSSLLIAGQVLSALGLPPTPKKPTPKEEPRKTSGS
ncbi:Processive diacylglycerol beta-glucosyltransferase [subsurface metagenome]